MNQVRRAPRNRLIAACCLAVAANFVLPGSSRAATTTAARDGRHDFDFEIGTWKIHMRRLLHPLSGSQAWVSPAGYVHVVRKVWGGRASLAELELGDPAKHYRGLMLRLYNPQSHQWSIYWASIGDGALDPPLVGQFSDGRGEFFAQQAFEGRSIFVRVIYSDITPTSFHTEQSFSSDGGKTWETNLIQDFTRTTRNSVSIG